MRKLSRRTGRIVKVDCVAMTKTDNLGNDGLFCGEDGVLAQSALVVAEEPDGANGNSITYMSNSMAAPLSTDDNVGYCPLPASMPDDDNGVTVSMLNSRSQFKVFGSLSALTVFSTDRPFAPGLPLLIGVQGELFTGAGLGEYNGGIGQTFDSTSFEAIRSSGGWGEVFACLTPKVHIHAGYGIDSPLRRSGDTFLLTENQTYFTNVVWNWTKNVQISNQVDYRKTSYRSPLLDAEGFVFYSEFLWKF